MTPLVDPTAFIATGVVLAGDVRIGAQASIWYNSVVRGDMAPVSIGDNSNLQDLSLIHVDQDLPCRIGQRVSVGHRAILHGCTVEDDCLIGMGAVVLNAALIGRGSVIGAGALVTEGSVIAPNSLVLGMPARVVRATEAKHSEAIDFAWRHYVEQARRHREGAVGLYRPR